MLEVLKHPAIRKKLLFTLFVIFVFRLLAHVPAPGVDREAVRAFFSGNALFGLFDLFSGGGFQNFSIITLSLGPYINASIILQLFTTLVPALEELSKEGEQGREKINQYTRMLTIPLAFLQSYGVYFLLNRQGVIADLNSLSLIVLIFTFTAGVLLLMWIGDLVTEYGIGNGISLLIFAGIISGLPSAALQFFSTTQSSDFINTLLVLAVAILVIFGVVKVSEGTRNIQIEYGRRGTKTTEVSVKNYLPLKVNQAGVIPIIFAVSVVLVPSLIGPAMAASSVEAFQRLGSFLAVNFIQTSLVYNLTYFLLVFGFTFFYTTIQFNPEKIADDLKKRGGFIPGIRPGLATERYLKAVLNRITLAGAIFLGLVAILPYLLTLTLGIGQNLAIGGTGLLIVVSVVLETIRQIESMVVTRNYESFLT